MVRGIGSQMPELFHGRNPVGLTLDFTINPNPTDDLGSIREILEQTLRQPQENEIASTNHTETASPTIRVAPTPLDTLVQEAVFDDNSTTSEPTPSITFSIPLATTTGVRVVDYSKNSDAHLAPLPDLEPLPSNYVPPTPAPEIKISPEPKPQPIQFFNTFENLCIRYAPERVPCASIRGFAERTFTVLRTAAENIAQAIEESAAPIAAIGGSAQAEPVGNGPRLLLGSAVQTAADQTATEISETGKKALLGLFLLFAYTNSKRGYVTQPSEPIFLPSPAQYSSNPQRQVYP